MPLRLEDYALLGDCETAALVGRDGSIDWLCWPRFDSDACFAALLGGPEHGHWQLAPADDVVRVARRYRPGTLILETDIDTAGGGVTLVDFMPLRGAASDIVRLVVGRHGRVTVRSTLRPRFGYGRADPWLSHTAEGDVCAVAGPDMLVLHAPVPHALGDGAAVAELTVAAGERAAFVLTYAPSHQRPPKGVDAEAALADTEEFWRGWSGRCTNRGPWTDAVTGSLVTLKALTYRPTGGIAAAPTTSLPERLGGVRNWDYRFCWLRDATFTLLALMNAGYTDEARSWRNWLLRAVAGNPQQMQIMYGLAGERRLMEWEADWLPGYEGSRPVRIGNAAAHQRQWDVFGEVMDALHQARENGLDDSEAGWHLQRVLMDHLEAVWEGPDEGIWETRGGPEHFTYSKVMAWVALDRAVKGIEHFGLEGPLDRWRALRRRIHDQVCERGFNAELGSFVQSYGSRRLDAALLLVPLVGFLPPGAPRVRGTVAAIERHLLADGLVLRYDSARTDDGLPAGEGAFLACSFWLADNYLLQGRQGDAVRLFRRLLDLRNDVGLLAEEYDPVARRLVGNFPQAFSHIALINTAQALTTVCAGPHQRAGESSPAG